jgi:hypothetical protein
VNEEEVALRGSEALHETAPALVPAAGGERHVPAAAPLHGRRLHLHPKEAVAEVRNDIDVRAVTERQEHLRAVAREPDHRRELADVALQPG